VRLTDPGRVCRQAPDAESAMSRQKALTAAIAPAFLADQQVHQRKI